MHAVFNLMTHPFVWWSFPALP